MLAGCALQPVSPAGGVVAPGAAVAPRLVWEPSSWRDVDRWPSFELHNGMAALQQSCRLQVRKNGWREVCNELPAMLGAGEPQQRHWLEQRFRPYRAVTTDGIDTGLITGYYEPLLSGDRKPGERARFPLFAVPDDLLVIDLADQYPELKGMRLRGRLNGRKVVPYHSRADIEAGKAGGLQGRELAWVDDAVELFFLQIQGSGRIRLPDGSFVRVGYAEQNGHPYKAIGKVLIERGELPVGKVSMQSIQAWARANPDKLQDVLNSNPSYVFFRELPAGTDGPPGAQGVPLTGGGSVAVDPRHVPLGTPLLLATTLPDNMQALRRMVVAQDTGGAIRGPLRGDFFWGFGAEAGRLAGLMKQQGKWWILWPKDAALPEMAP